MRNLQNLQSLSGFQRGATPLTLETYIKSLSGLIAYYPLNETSGNAINQAPATIGTLNGTVTGATQGVDGLVGKAYSFDGVNDEVVLPNDISVKNQSLVNIGAVVEIKNTAAARSIYNEPKTSDLGGRLLFYIESNETVNLALRADDTISQQTIGTSAGLSVGFHIVIFSLDVANKTIVIYVDGVSKSLTGSIAGINSTTFTNSNPNVAPRIGNRVGGTAPYDGIIQHAFFIYNTLITSDQALKMAQLAGLA